MQHNSPAHLDFESVTKSVGVKKYLISLYMHMYVNEYVCLLK